MDTFVRSYMDVEGYVPLSLLYQYQNVACVGALYYDVVEKAKNLHPQSVIEYDATTDTVRVKEGWEKVGY
jgi:hypothetical protein